MMASLIDKWGGPHKVKHALYVIHMHYVVHYKSTVPMLHTTSGWWESILGVARNKHSPSSLLRMLGAKPPSSPTLQAEIIHVLQDLNRTLDLIVVLNTTEKYLKKEL